MAFPDIVIGSAGQAVVGFDIVIGDVSAPEGALVDFVVPATLEGVAMLILIVRNENPVICSDSTWTKVIDGSGASGLFLDAWQRTVDGTAGSNAGDVISFVSESIQELQGGLVLVRRPLVATLINDVAHEAFTSTLAPSAPAVDVVHEEDSLLCVWSAAGVIDFTASTEQTSIDEYGSSVFSARTILITSRGAEATGAVTPESASADVSASGRAFTISVRAVPRILNPSAHAGRSHPANVTNPSGHTRRM